MAVNIASIRNRCITDVMEMISAVTRGHDDGDDWTKPRTLLADEAYHHVRLAIRTAVDFRPERMAEYLRQFPDLLKRQTSGRALEDEIEAALISEIERPLMPVVREKLIEQYAGQTLEDVVKTLSKAALGSVGDDRLVIERNAFHDAWKELVENTRWQTLSRMMKPIASLADRMEELGTVTFGSGSVQRKINATPYVLRLREMHDFLDLSLERDGFDALLEPMPRRNSVGRT